jgi:hypothetical protein
VGGDGRGLAPCDIAPVSAHAAHGHRRTNADKQRASIRCGRSSRTTRSLRPVWFISRSSLHASTRGRSLFPNRKKVTITSNRTRNNPQSASARADATETEAADSSGDHRAVRLGRGQGPQHGAEAQRAVLAGLGASRRGVGSHAGPDQRAPSAGARMAATRLRQDEGLEIGAARLPGWPQDGAEGVGWVHLALSR